MADAAADVLPGGNTRSVLDFAPYPFRVAHATGAFLEDVDGHRYLDLLGNYSAGLLGHDSAPVKEAVRTALDGGWSLGAVHDREARFAELLIDRFPSVDLVRFTNSGTEANLMAIATAKHGTARSKVLVCDGGYHGGVLHFGTAGSPLLVPHDWLRMTFNDVASAEAAFTGHGTEIACVLVEPMLGAGGCIPARPEFLAALRTLTQRDGAVLVFDEVMTSRLSTGGAQQILGITPDMTTLGKYLAGGMTFGAFGGRRELMQMYGGGGLAHGGTFNNNVLTMAGGVVTLGSVLTEEALADVNARGERLRSALNRVFEDAGLPMCVTGWGSLMNIHPVAGPVDGLSDLAAADTRLKELLFLDMLDEGYYFAARGYIALTMAVTDEDLNAFTDAVARWSTRMAAGA